MDFKDEIGERLKQKLNIDKKYILENIELTELGVYTFPCFKIKEEINNEIDLFAEELKNQIYFNDLGEIKVVGPYVNFYINKDIIVKKIASEIIEEGNSYGDSDKGKGKKVFINNPYGISNFEKVNSNTIYNILIKVFKVLGYSICTVDKKYINSAKNIKRILEQLKSKELLVEDSGAIIVRLSKYNLPPYLVYKDEAVIADKELTGVTISLYENDFHMSVNVVDSSNITKFLKVGAVAEILGYEMGKYIWVKNTYLVDKAVREGKKTWMKCKEVIEELNINNIQVINVELKEELDLVKDLVEFPKVISNVCNEVEVNILGEYILNISKKTGDLCKMKNITHNTLVILKSAFIVIEKCLYLMEVDIL